MSRIAKKPIEMPAGVNLTVDGQTITAKGPKGELSLTVNDAVAFEQNDNVLTFKIRSFFSSIKISSYISLGISVDSLA